MIIRSRRAVSFLINLIIQYRLSLRSFFFCKVFFNLLLIGPAVYLNLYLIKSLVLMILLWILNLFYSCFNLCLPVYNAIGFYYFWPPYNSYAWSFEWEMNSLLYAFESTIFIAAVFDLFCFLVNFLFYFPH